MTLFGNIHYDIAELFVLAESNPVEFERLIEADNMISLCAAIENVYNVEAFIMREVEGCYISSADKMREDLSLEVFKINTGLGKHISLNFEIFKQVTKTLKKLERLVNVRHDGTAREQNKIGIAWKLGTYVNLNHLEETKRRFALAQLDTKQRDLLARRQGERVFAIKNQLLAGNPVMVDDFFLPGDTHTAETLVVPAVKIFFDFEPKRKTQALSCFLNQAIDIFFEASIEQMQTISQQTFPKRDGFFERVIVEGLIFDWQKPIDYIMSLRFDGRRDVGPRGVYVSLTKLMLFITVNEEEENNDLYKLLNGSNCIVRGFGLVKDEVEKVVCEKVCLREEKKQKGFFQKTLEVFVRFLSGVYEASRPRILLTNPFLSSTSEAEIRSINELRIQRMQEDVETAIED